jgi:integrase
MTTDSSCKPATPGSSNMAQIKAAVETSTDLSSRQRREILSAITSLGRWRDLPLSQIPATAETLRRHFAAIHPEHVGVSARRMANARSAVNKALVIAGVRAANLPVAEVLAPAWAELRASISSRYLSTSLTPFVRFCSERGIEPCAVDEGVSAQYHEFLTNTSLRKNPRATHQTLCRAWNAARKQIAGWPDVELRVPSYRETYTLGWDAFPQPLHDEVEAYLKRLSQEDVADILDETAPRRPLSAQTIKTKRYQILQYLSALVHQGVPIETLTSLAVAITPTFFKLGLRYLLDRPRANKDNTRSAGFVAHTIRSIAKYWLRLAPEDVVSISNITNRLNTRQIGMTEKNRHRLNQFADEMVISKLIDLPYGELDRLLACRSLTYHQAVEASVCLALMLLCFMPVRIKNLAALRFEEHIKLPFQDKAGETIITIPAGQVKNRQALSFILPATVTTYIVRYRKHIKRHLETEVSTVLFPNGRGQQKRSDTLGKQISQLVWKKLGIAFNPHLMRHLAAKINIDANPGNYEGVRRLLGHKSHETTYNTYEGLETKSASLLHDDIVRSKRSYVPMAERPRAKKRLRAPDQAASADLPKAGKVKLSFLKFRRA